jgi:NTE family protein
MRTGLVLGAGGIVGQAYHAGVLAAFEEAGWDPRTADVVVGSSAGSLTGALLRLGLSAHDLAAWATEGEPSADGEALLAALGTDIPELPLPSPRELLRGWRLPSRHLIARAARRPWAFRPGVAAITLLPTGRLDIRQRAQVLDRDGDDWPDDLWICVARRSDGHRVVLGRPGSPRSLLSDAVAASCAIPGYLAPVEIDGRQYIDGGVHSPTNADVLARSRLDIVVVVAPMSGHGVVTGPDAAVRWSSRRRLDREVARLRAAGTEVIRVEPTRRVLATMGINAMADDRAQPVVTAGRRQASALLRRPGLAGRLALLRDASAAAEPAA